MKRILIGLLSFLIAFNNECFANLTVANYFTGTPSQVVTPSGITESTGTKLRRSAELAKATNPWAEGKLYMKSIPPWQPLVTSVGTGTTMVVSNGQIYYESYTGTTAGIVGPTTVTSNSTIADGSMYWLWGGVNQVTSDEFTTQTAWAQSTSYSLNAQVIANGSVYACVGTTTYTFTVSGVSVYPTANAVYTNNGHTFYIISGAANTVVAVGTGAPGSSGTLSKSSGTGDSSISFSAVVTATTSAGSGTGPSGTGAAIVDSGIVWNYMGPVYVNPYNSIMPNVSTSSTQPSGLTNIFYPTGNGSTSSTGNTNANITLLNAFPVGGGYNYAVGDTFTLDTSTSTVYSGLLNPTVGSSGGTGYANGDIGTVNGGTCSRQPKYIVTSASGGVVQAGGVAVYDVGICSTYISSTNAATTATTGSGSGLTINSSNTNTTGVGSIPMEVQVTSVSSGAVTGLKIINAGNYTTAPQTISGNYLIGVGTTSGSGSGLTILAEWSGAPWEALRGANNAGGGSGSLSSPAVSFQATTNGTPIVQHFTEEFYTDAAKFWIKYPYSGTAGWGVIIDGIRYSLASPSNLASASNLFTLFDFTTTGGRKKRHIQLDVGLNNIQLSSIGVTSNDTVWAPSNNDLINAVFISDSICAGSGYGPFWADNSVVFRLRDELGWNNIWDYCIGGTGYINRGAGPGVSTDAYGTRLAQAAALNPQVIIFMGSTNDSGQSSSLITSTVTSDLQTLRTDGYTGIIIVFGVWPVNASALTTENAVAAGVTAFSDPLSSTYFIPLYNRTTDYPYITGTWNDSPLPNGSYNSNATNANIYINTGDNIHPVDAGTEYLAKRLALDIQNYVYPNIK